MPSCPKDPKPVRSEPYRRLVASLACALCGIEGASQACHPNAGKAKGAKASDLLCFALCHAGANDCHGKFDRYETAPHGARRRQAELEPHLAAMTQAMLIDLAQTDDSVRRVLAKLGML